MRTLTHSSPAARALARVALVVLACLWLPGAAEQKAADPYELKAAALYKVALYAKWPESAFGGREEPLRVAVFGADPFGTELERALKGKKLGSHPFAALHFATLGELGECQILFVPEKEEASLAKILEREKGRPVLLIGETVAAAEAGAGIALYFEKSKLQVAVNQQAVRASGLELSSELLKLARLVGVRKEGGAK
jgi:hypothetical protein